LRPASILRLAHRCYPPTKFPVFLPPHSPPPPFVPCWCSRT
jgi:hypothetical protein